MPPVAPASRSTALITWLVVFVLFWVVATVFAIYFYVDSSKTTEKLDSLNKQYADVIPTGELGSDEITALKNRRSTDTTGTYNPSMSVFDTLRTERNELATRIDGGNVPDQSAKTAADTLATVGAQVKDAGVPSLPPTLNSAIKALADTLVKRQQEVASLNGELKKATETAAQANKEKEAYRETVQKEVAEASANAQQANDSKTAELAAKDDQIKKMIVDSEVGQKGAQDQLAQAQSNISDLTKKNTDLQRRLDDALGKLGLKRSNTADAMVRQADGTIVRVPGNGTVYINLGSGDQISPGLTFEIFDRADGIPSVGDVANDDNLPKGKGSIEVVRVGAGSSECRIITTQPGQVIHEGDLISNLIYDRNVKSQFFIYGDFDLDQNGVTTPQDAEVVKRLVTQWGGKVTDKINADTDYVVLGKEPTVIVPTKEEASDPIMQAKAQASVAALDAYQAVKQQAIEYHIPILNQNRFLYYVGYFEAAKR